MRRLAVLFGTLFSVLSSSRQAGACAVCAAGDPSLAPSAAEVPFRNRVSVATDLRVASFLGTAPSAVAVGEPRLDLRASWAPAERWSLAVLVPLVHRSLAVAGDGRDVASLGDVDLRLRGQVFRSPPSRLRARVLVFGGAKLPTAPTQSDPLGRPLPVDLQPGCASVVPLVGLTVSLRTGPWSVDTSAEVLLPFAVRDDPHPGRSLRGAVVAQVQPTKAVAARLGAQLRWDGEGAVGVRSEPRSGGVALYVTPEIVLRPVGDLVLSVGAAFPAAQELRGYRVTAPVALATLSVDF
jgi:hypothetical protein